MGNQYKPRRRTWACPCRYAPCLVCAKPTYTVHRCGQHLLANEKPREFLRVYCDHCRTVATGYAFKARARRW